MDVQAYFEGGLPEHIEDDSIACLPTEVLGLLASGTLNTLYGTHFPLNSINPSVSNLAELRPTGYPKVVTSFSRCDLGFRFFS